jgi:hypothetical protein
MVAQACEKQEKNKKICMDQWENPADDQRRQPASSWPTFCVVLPGHRPDGIKQFSELQKGSQKKPIKNEEPGATNAPDAPGPR